ncbi:MAG TPA: hypothetical protein VFN23_02030 [Ktedonobacteraceae bacterium]|nr:hypothetical protein [Ktedonobacteraceae bacterium]
MDSFPSIAFQTSLSTEGILFGVFGFLYSVYSVYSADVTPDNLERAPVVLRLRQVCRVLVGIILLNAILTVYSLIEMDLPSLSDLILAAGFVVIMVAIVLITMLWAFVYME